MTFFFVSSCFSWSIFSESRYVGMGGGGGGEGRGRES